MSGQKNLGDYSSDDDDICTSNRKALRLAFSSLKRTNECKQSSSNEVRGNVHSSDLFSRTFKMKGQHYRNLKSQEFLSGFTSLFMPNFKAEDRGNYLRYMK